MPLSAAGNAPLDLTAVHASSGQAARRPSVDLASHRTEFRLLGPLEVVHRGAPLAAGGHKKRALLARLVLDANRTVSVQRLVDALWGDEAPPTAVKMVQIYVSQLRKVLPGGVLRTRSPGYVLEVAPEAVDLHRFGRLRAEARAALAGRDPARGAELLRAALALWRGPALAEFPEPFAVVEAAHLEELRLAAVEERVDADLALGRHVDIVGELRVLVAGHPLRQRLRAQLMLALYRAGRHAEALDAFQDFRGLIRDELGLEPPGALGELQYRILQQDPGLDLPPGGGPAATAPARPVRLRRDPAAARGDPGGLVGRAAELGRLERALDAAAAGRGTTALLAGPAGIGKTRLAGELAERARRLGAPVLTGRCIDLVGASVPYLPLVEALRPLRGSSAVDGLDELAGLMPGAGARPAGAPGDRTAGLSRLQLFEEVIELLDRLGAGGPVVLVVEDLHWADASTLDLLAYLAHAARERPLLLLGTARWETVHHDGALGRLATGLARAGLAELVELGPLARAELEVLLARRSDAPLEPAISEDVCARSEGNPFFAEELLAAALRGEDALPGRLRDVLLADVRRLDPRTRSLVRVAAAAGRAVPPGLLTAASGLPDAELLEALREAVEHGVLVPDPSGRTYRFRHALIAEAAYATLLPCEREDVHARLAVALARRPSLAASGAGAGEVAEHWIAAGRPVEALTASLRAARDAQAVSGLAEALRHLERVLDLWEHVPDAEDVAGLAMSGLLAWAGDLAGALETRDGASVPAQLGVAEARELYPLAVVLESLAVRRSPRLPAAVLAALRDANGRLRAALHDPPAAVQADDLFHAQLTCMCGDASLLAVLRPVKRALLRYEQVYMREPARVLRSAAQHDRIVEALEVGDHPAAAQRLRQNLTGGLPDLTPALER